MPKKIKKRLQINRRIVRELWSSGGKISKPLLGSNDNHDLFPNPLQITDIISHISSTLFRWDTIGITLILDKSTHTEVLLEEMKEYYNYQYTQKSTKGNTSKILKSLKNRLWKKRHVFNTDDNIQIALFTHPTDLMNYNDAQLYILHATPKTLLDLEKFLIESKKVISYAINRCEHTFDFEPDEQYDVSYIALVFKYTKFQPKSRTGFTIDDDGTETEYANPRTSSRQGRDYEKTDDEFSEYYRDIFDIEPSETRTTFRTEVTDKRRKLKSRKIKHLHDLFNYAQNVPNEYLFLRVKENSLNRTSLNRLSDGYFPKLIKNSIFAKGMQKTITEGKKWKKCPAHCNKTIQQGCQIRKNRDARPSIKFFAIQKCKHAKPFSDFKGQFFEPIPEMDCIKESMVAAVRKYLGEYLELCKSQNDPPKPKSRPPTVRIKRQKLIIRVKSDSLGRKPS